MGHETSTVLCRKGQPFGLTLDCNYKLNGKWLCDVLICLKRFNTASFFYIQAMWQWLHVQYCIHFEPNCTTVNVQCHFGRVNGSAASHRAKAVIRNVKSQLFVTIMVNRYGRQKYLIWDEDLFKSHLNRIREFVQT